MPNKKQPKEIKYRIAIDGPAASGKSSAAELVAQKLGFSRLDSGLLYRAITFLVLDKFGDLPDEKSCKMEDFIKAIKIRFDKGKIYYMNPEDLTIQWTNITNELRSPTIDINSSILARIFYVRERVREMQFEINEREKGAMVIDGRDIGTVVFPDAFLKIFITAKASTRAMRRAKQNSSKNYEEILAEIEKRDESDIHREHGPLKQAKDAIRIDNDDMTLEETVDKIFELFNEKVKRINK